MEFTLYELLTAFLLSIIIGFLLGVIYEPIRVIHILGIKGKLSYFVLDAIFMIICGIITFYFCLAMLEGRIRGFVILGEIIGFFIYRYTLKPVFDIFYRPIIKLFKKILKKVLKISGNVMYNIKIKTLKFFNCIKNKVIIYEKRRYEKRKNRRGKEKRSKRSTASKEKT